MELDFSNIPLVISMAIGLLIVALHAVSCLIDKPFAKWLSYLNVALHLVATFTMLYAGSSIDLLVLCYMISILFCCSFYYVGYARASRKAKCAECAEENLTENEPPTEEATAEEAPVEGEKEGSEA